MTDLPHFLDFLLLGSSALSCTPNQTELGLTSVACSISEAVNLDRDCHHKSKLAMSVFFLSITALCAVSAANLNPINVLLDVSFSSGEAYVNITLGNNEIAVILDSGSSTLAVPIQYSECKGVCFDTCQGPFGM